MLKSVMTSTTKIVDVSKEKKRKKLSVLAKTPRPKHCFFSAK